MKLVVAPPANVAADEVEGAAKAGVVKGESRSPEDAIDHSLQHARFARERFHASFLYDTGNEPSTWSWIGWT
jgi:hypothetical protein